jgi:glucokinase
MNLLVADIGGTKSLLALATLGATGWSLEARTRYASRAFPDLSAILQQWQREHPAAAARLDGMGIAVAGPVTGTPAAASARLTNLDWPPLHSAELGRVWGLPVVLLNDFVAVGLSLEALAPTHLRSLQPGVSDPQGLRLVVGPGTGLGVCWVAPSPQGVVYAAEGGHAGFAPADAEEAHLCAWIRTREGFCSRELVLSGRGIARIAEYLLTRGTSPPAAQPASAHAPSALSQGLPRNADRRHLQAALQAEDPAAAIGTAAQEGEPGAVQVLDCFAELLAGQLGDLALSALPRGGIFLAGGIPPRFPERFARPAFRQAFCQHPPMQSLLADLPITLILHPEPGLLGAARAAQDLCMPPT